MGKYTSRNPMWPDWFDGKKIDEVTFCGLFLHDHPMKCIDGRFFTPDGLECGPAGCRKARVAHEL